MRDILFRGKCMYTGKWVEGYLVKISEDDYRIATEEDINWSYTKLGDYDGVMTCVNPETICQYTGMTDKNGNKIWENDVCSTDLKRRYKIVRFRNGCFMYNVNDGGEDYYDIMMPIEPLVDSDEFTEVIGNIFDNPELLKNE